MIRRTIAIAVSSILSLHAAEPGNGAQGIESAEHKAKRMAWFREARFGMFIHWGVYAVPAGMYHGKRVDGLGEWIMSQGQIPTADYRAFAKGFTASAYDPDAWAALAKRAGMRYVVLTAKHHDGCALFDTAASDWSIPKTAPARRDVVAPLEKAVRAQGLRFGLYYSQAQDWNNPGGAAKRKWDVAQEGPNARALIEQKADITSEAGKKAYEAAQQADFDLYLKQVSVPQVDELLRTYHPDLMWWDTPLRMTKERASLFFPILSKYPDLVINDRLARGFGDYETPEQRIPPRGYPGRDFEVCMTMNKTWGYQSFDDLWKPTSMLLKHLSDITSKGGNFLLNVGPTPEGVIPQPSVEGLQRIGAWMDVHGEAIHGTQGSPFSKVLPWGRATRRDNADGTQTLYLHVWDWPKDGALRVPLAGQPGATARLLAGKTAVPVAQDGTALVLTLPTAASDPILPVVRLDLPKPVVDNADPVEKPDAQGVIHLSPLDAESTVSFQGNHVPRNGSGDGLHLGPWTDTECRLRYGVSTPKNQTWAVSAEIAATDPVTMRVYVGDLSKTAAVPATGGAESWKTVDLGTIELKAGDGVFILRAETKDYKPIRVRTVTLTPAK